MFIEINNRLHESELTLVSEEAEVLLAALLKEKSYWEYRLKQYIAKIGRCPNTSQLKKLTEMERNFRYCSGIAKKIKKLLDAESQRQRL
jgi:hypothetical protein